MVAKRPQPDPVGWIRDRFRSEAPGTPDGVPGAVVRIDARPHRACPCHA
jgi:hypothetical protein